MIIIRSPEDMQAAALQIRRTGLRIGFVPTMGFLHDGHLSLMRLAREHCEWLVVSIFVNPSQFGPGEDLDAYPRDFERDEALCAEAGAAAIFYPEPESMYAADASTWVDETMLSGDLCGASRPGHFRGVCTVVAKLFNLVLPDVAVFGEKDAQQLRIIERMVRDLNFPVRILRGPIVREPDGLAMSSRNKYLNADQRSQARCLKAALDGVREAVQSGTSSVDALHQLAEDRITQEPDASVDYIAFVEDETLKPVTVVEGRVLVALAVRIDLTRLIDNMTLDV